MTRRVAGARLYYWAALGFVVGYHMLLTPFTLRWPL